jgi:taurine dioxygenase
MAIKLDYEYETIAVEPISHIIGAEISGVDLSKELSDSTIDEIYHAVVSHCVVVFRNQHLSMGQYEGFAKRFGPLYHQSYDPAPIAPGTQGLSLLDVPASMWGGEAWHADEPWMQMPPIMALLGAIEIPPYGGDTLFASMYEAYDQLSETMKSFLEPLMVHYDGPGDSVPRRLRELGNLDTPEANEKRKRYEETLEKVKLMPPVDHHLIKVHPDTGRKHLYLSPAHAKSICELTKPESNALLAFLGNHVQLSQFQYRNRWSAGDIALWDERTALHNVVPDYVDTRKMWRCYIAGEKGERVR